MNKDIKNIPGPIPARNNAITDSSVINPYTIIGKLGGINIPNVPPAAKRPYTKFLLYPLLIISGIATTPMVAAVATDTPEIAAKIPHEIIVATARPPGQCPTQACTALNKSFPHPPFKSTLLIKRKSGTASKIKPSRVDKIAWGAIKGEKPPKINIESPRNPREKDTGRPDNNKTNINVRTKSIVIINDYFLVVQYFLTIL